MATTNLLIVTDDTETAGAVADRLRGGDISVGTVRGGKEALEALGSKPIGVLLVDSAEWRDNGEFRDTLASNHPALPVVVLTESDEPSRGLIAHLQLGAMTFVPRDSGARRLRETITSIIEIAGRNPFRDRVKPYLSAGEAVFQFGNDPSIVPVIVGYTQRLLEDYGLASEKESLRAGVALSEALANAIIHGNLEVPSTLREGDGAAWYAAIDRQRTLEPFASRTVQVTVRFSKSSATFVVRDQGKGFDPATLGDPTDPENLLKASGRGVLLMRAYMNLVSWSEAGNEVTLVKEITA